MPKSMVEHRAKHKSPTAWLPFGPEALTGENGRGDVRGRTAGKAARSGSPAEIRSFGFSPEGDTSLPVCVSHRIWAHTPTPQAQRATHGV